MINAIHYPTEGQKAFLFIPMDDQKPGSESREKQEAWWLPAMHIFFRTAGWIAAPVIIALFVGSWLEDKYGSETHYILISAAVAFVVTMAGLLKTTLSELKKMDEKTPPSSKK